MTPIKFILRYTAIRSRPSCGDLDCHTIVERDRCETICGAVARVRSFLLPFRREISETMDHGRINDRRYQALVRDSLGNGVALDWPASGVGALADERHKLAELIQADSDLQGHHQ